MNHWPMCSANKIEKEILSYHVSRPDLAWFKFIELTKWNNFTRLYLQNCGETKIRLFEKPGEKQSKTENKTLVNYQ